jgi:hypothetical protein
MLQINTLLSLAYDKHCYEGWRYIEGRLCKALLYCLSFMLNIDILLSVVNAKHFNGRCHYAECRYQAHNIDSHYTEAPIVDYS